MFEKKWDWELAYALYIGGMGPKEISQVEQFKGCSPRVIANYAHIKGWSKAKREASTELGQQLARTLAERLAEAGDVHQEWMRQKLQRERDVINKALIIDGNMTSQAERLKNMQILDEMTRKLTGLDERKQLNATQQNLNITVHLAGGYAPRLKGVKAAIVEPGNGMSVLDQTGKKRIKPGTKNLAASILRAKETGEPIVYDTDDIEIPEIELDRSQLKPLSGPVFAQDEPLVDEKTEDHSTGSADYDAFTSKVDEASDELIDAINASGQFHAFDATGAQNLDDLKRMADEHKASKQT